ncbi:hypothetical protein [Candidatus Pelagibacter sp. HIMB1509]|uniref:hypothetical protein n=1 Tax=Candidatus Pelagibacter sp. HIMB1509 TaxID=3413339 RepID=UPI003F85D568
MGKIISAKLATDDYDPMNLLGTSAVFSPRKHRIIKINKENKSSEKLICKTKSNIDISSK